MRDRRGFLTLGFVVLLGLVMATPVSGQDQPALSERAAPRNDDSADAEALVADFIMMHPSNEGATTATGEPLLGGDHQIGPPSGTR